MTSTAMLVLTVWCAALSAFDVRERRLPDALTLPGAAVILGYGFAVGTPEPAVSGALLLAVPYLLVHLCSPAALGAGDVKLALGLGAATALGSPRAWSWAALAAPMLTAAAATGALLTPVVMAQLGSPEARPGRLRGVWRRSRGSAAGSFARPMPGDDPPTPATAAQGLPPRPARLFVVPQWPRHQGTAELTRAVIPAMIAIGRAARSFPARSTPVQGGCGAPGEVGTLPHGPAMCVASVVALLAGR